MKVKWVILIYCFFIGGIVVAQYSNENEYIREKSNKIRSAAISDEFGNIYAVNVTNSSSVINPGTSTYAAVHTNNVYVSKTDTAGNILWKKRLRGLTTYDYCEPAIALDDSGNVYVTYNRISVSDGWNSFIVRLNDTGDIVWTECLGDSDKGGINARSITVDDKRMLCITGFFWGKIDFNTDKGISNLVSENQTGVFACRMNENGKYIWIRGIEKTDPGCIINEQLSAAEYIETTTAIISQQ